MGVLFLFDKLVAPPNARWFSIHAFGNLLAVITATYATYCTLADPAEAMSSLKYNDSSLFGNATPWPIIIVNAIHVYHMVAFKLSSADYFHHLVFAATMGKLICYLLQHTLTSYNISCFLTCINFIFSSMHILTYSLSSSYFIQVPLVNFTDSVHFVHF